MKTYLGIDISKLHLDTSHLGRPGQLANPDKAIALWLKSPSPDVILACEASGGDEARLIAQAHARHHPIIPLRSRGQIPPPIICAPWCNTALISWLKSRRIPISPSPSPTRNYAAC